MADKKPIYITGSPRGLRNQAEKFNKAAWALYREGHLAIARYLACYTVELALKALRAHNNRRRFLKTHVLAELVEDAGLTQELTDKCASSSRFKASWDAVKGWNPEIRYEIKNHNAEALRILNAVGRKDGDGDGVWTWLYPKCKSRGRL
ncbi:MAG TPA: HEPN domain-containing protein [Planctomycetota bacterium]|nr:HEPN domain-containing protein [Planctomycetota bacterium]